MTISVNEHPRAMAVSFSADAIIVDLADGRTITAPLGWYPRLVHATTAERANFRFIGNQHGLHWPDLDEDISVENLLLGQPSGESHDSFSRWLNARPTP